MLTSISIKAYSELLLVVCLVFYFCNNTRLQCLPPFWQEATMKFNLLFVLYCKLFAFATTLYFIANLHLHRTIASYRIDAFFKVLQGFNNHFLFFFFMFCMLFVFYCKLITYASLLDSTSTKYHNTNVYFNIFQASICHLIWNNS